MGNEQYVICFFLVLKVELILLIGVFYLLSYLPSLVRLMLSPSKGKVSVLLNHGMVVHVSDHIKGLVPRTHLSDIILKNPEKKYMEGMKIKCRVSPVLYFEKTGIRSVP